ncbi:Nonribosomal peptide synthetase 8 [Frankliniella fusca]|uniref:Nonribosomal peptide synthetase 8 n=1 Tax=Frankliniella fusca TaxID=407009 RepID=A0AAE1HDK6_9NEOP|nr:Nonribosomal peptide synthetase 8 [Frankliniella fusca]
MARTSAQLVALGLLWCVAAGAAFTSDFHALYLLGTPLSGQPRPQRGGAVGRRNREQQQQLQDTPLRVIAELDLANMPVRYRSAEQHLVVERLDGPDRGRHAADGADDPEDSSSGDDALDELRGDGDAASPQVSVVRKDHHGQVKGGSGPGPGPEAPSVHRNEVAASARVKKNYAEDNEDYALDEDYDEDELAAAAAANTYGHSFHEDAEAETLPFWHHPCGRSVDLVVPSPKGSSGRSAKTVARKINKALERVWRQLNMTVLHYKLQRFDKLYYQVVIGVNEDDYIPSWVPSKDDLPVIGPDDVKSPKLAHELTRMHTQLQKFSVALEQMSEDNRLDNPMRHNALSETKKHVKLLLCEVEWALLSLAIPLPLAVSRKIMSPSERNITDNTNREIRDWGVLIKYRDFLHGWANVVAMADRGGAARSRRSSRIAAPAPGPGLGKAPGAPRVLWGPRGLWAGQDPGVDEDSGEARDARAPGQAGPRLRHAAGSRWARGSGS